MPGDRAESGGPTQQQINQQQASANAYQAQVLKNKIKEYEDKDSLFNKMQTSDTNYTETAKAAQDNYKLARKDANSGYNSAQSSYLKNQNTYEGNYKQKQTNLGIEAELQGKDATKTYGTIQPKLKGLMDQSYENAQSAMSLKDAGDPNNAVAKGYRDLYEKNIEGERNTGYQDFGVLSALGNQASQVGGSGTMTVGQQMAMQAANQRSAGEAFAKTQQRISSLRDAGLAAGREESAAQYERGAAAQEDAAARANEYFNTDTAFGNRMSGLRGERAGYDGGVLASLGRVNDTKMGVSQERYARGMGDSREDMDMMTGNAADSSNREKMIVAARLGDQAQMAALAAERANAQAASDAASKNAQAAMWGQVAGAVGTAVGTAVGGPAGGAVLGSAGNTVATGVAGGTNNTPNQVQVSRRQSYPVYGQNAQRG